MAFAQQKPFIINDTTGNGTVKFRRYNVSLNPQSVEKEQQLLQSVLGLSKDDSLALAGTTKDSLGFTHKFYQQFYKGLKVEFGNYATHSRNGILEIINGEFAKVGHPVTIPSISEAQALSYALKYINAQIYKWQVPAEESGLKELKKDSAATYYPKGELLICYDQLQTKTYRLAFRFTISAYLPTSSNDVFVDAITGKIIAKQNLILDGNAPATVNTKYSGFENITTDQYINNGTTMYRLNETRGTSNVSIETYNSQRIQSTAHVEFTDANNTWTALNNANMDNAALDAHWAMEKIYDYWNTIRGRNSYDGAGAPMISFVHYNWPWEILNGVPQYHSGTDNSSWELDAHQVYLGDGYAHCNPLTSLDVCAHEFGHGFTEGAQPALFNTHGILINSDGLHPEALALNEGISDIWGAVVENWATSGKQTWEMGEDIMKDGKPCLRSLQNPKTAGDNSSDFTSTGGYPDTYHGTYWDYNNASHTNATVIGHWFYLLSQGGSSTNDLGNSYNVAGIGITEAANIVWRAEQNYLGVNSQYSDARTAMITAATDLYCANSPEVAAVTNAWYAVGVGAAYSGGVMSISGPSFICTTATYSVANLPAGTSTIWSSSSPSDATISSSGVATKVNIGSTSISADLTGTSGCKTSLSTGMIPVGQTPVNFTIVKPWCSGNTERWNITTTPLSYGSNWHWTVDYLGANSQINISSPYSASTNVDVTGGGTIKLTYTNACGAIETNSLTVYSSCHTGYSATNFTVAPNPAENDIMVSAISDNNLMGAKTEIVSTSNVIYGIRITDVSGIVRKSFEYKAGIQSIKISVAELTSGIYTLSVFDGKQWQSQNIIIQK